MQKTTFQYMSKWHQTKVSTERFISTFNWKYTKKRRNRLLVTPMCGCGYRILVTQNPYVNWQRIGLNPSKAISSYAQNDDKWKAIVCLFGKRICKYRKSKKSHGLEVKQHIWSIKTVKGDKCECIYWIKKNYFKSRLCVELCIW